LLRAQAWMSTVMRCSSPSRCRFPDLPQRDHRRSATLPVQGNGAAAHTHSRTHGDLVQRHRAGQRVVPRLLRAVPRHGESSAPAADLQRHGCSNRLRHVRGALRRHSVQRLAAGGLGLNSARDAVILVKAAAPTCTPTDLILTEINGLGAVEVFNPSGADHCRCSGVFPSGSSTYVSVAHRSTLRRGRCTADRAASAEDVDRVQCPEGASPAASTRGCLGFRGNDHVPCDASRGRHLVEQVQSIN